MPELGGGGKGEDFAFSHYFAIIVYIDTSIPKRILLKGNQATKPQQAWSQLNQFWVNPKKY